MESGSLPPRSSTVRTASTASTASGPTESAPDPAAAADAPTPVDASAPMSAPDPAPRHVPVFLGRVVELLGPALDGTAVPGPATVVDATLGLGGHLIALLQAHPDLVAIGIDRDRQALALAETRLSAAGLTDRVRLVHAVYDRIGEIIAADGPAGGVQGVLFDLGVSSMQLDSSVRGFAYAQDAPLDMRMDSSTGPTAADVLNTYSAAELTRVLRVYGEERFAARIAAAVVAQRDRAPWRTSARLVELIRDAIPAPARRTGGHPAKRTFQALRIEVNDELAGLTRAIPAALDGLAVGGRLVVLSYHSLEDRIVKRAIDPATHSTTPLDLPVDLPEHRPALRWLTRGAKAPTPQEIQANPRAASARLRAAERIRTVAA